MGRERGVVGSVVCLTTWMFAAAALGQVPKIDLAALTAEQCEEISKNGVQRPTEMVDEASYAKYRDDLVAECIKKFPIKKPPFILDLTKSLSEILSTMTGLLGVLSGFVIALAGFGIVLRSKYLEFQKALTAEKLRTSDPIYSSASSYVHEAVNMVVVGEGGSGKTTLIHAFCGSNDGGPTVSTGSFATYSLIKDIGLRRAGVSTRRITRVYVDDYVGQDFRQIVYNEELTKRKKFIRSTTLVIVVDIAFPDSGKSFSADDIDKDRVSQQLDFYNEGVIQILSSFVQEGDKVVVFINKLDILKSITLSEINRAKKLYDPLIQKLRNLRGRSVHVIVGSAAKGWGVIGDDNGNLGDTSLYEVIVDSGATVSEATLQDALKENAV